MTSRTITRAVNLATTGGLVASAALATCKLFNVVTWSWWLVALPGGVPLCLVTAAVIYVQYQLNHEN